jgi:hypothetical protein
MKNWADAIRLAVLVGLVAWPLVMLLAAAVVVLGVIVWRANW